MISIKNHKSYNPHLKICIGKAKTVNAPRYKTKAPVRGNENLFYQVSFLLVTDRGETAEIAKESLRRNILHAGDDSKQQHQMGGMKNMYKLDNVPLCETQMKQIEHEPLENGHPCWLAGVARTRERRSPKSLDSDENFKPYLVKTR